MYSKVCVTGCFPFYNWIWLLRNSFFFRVKEFQRTYQMFNHLFSLDVDTSQKFLYVANIVSEFLKKCYFTQKEVANCAWSVSHSLNKCALELIFSAIAPPFLHSPSEKKPLITKTKIKMAALFFHGKEERPFVWKWFYISKIFF